MSFSLPPDFAARISLNDELHAHAYVPLTPPERLVSITMLVTAEQRGMQAEHLQRLCSHMGKEVPADTSRTCIDFGTFRLKVENHQESTRYKLVRSIKEPRPSDPFSASPVELLPEGWLAGLPGQLLAALDVSILPYPEDTSHQQLADQYAAHFDAAALTASQVGRSENLALTDFRIRPDGMSRILLFSKARLATQIGRLTHRILEMEIYRMLALLALPEARKLLNELPEANQRLTALTGAISDGGGADDERLMQDLTSLAAYVENLVASNYKRFASTNIYFDLVFRRLDELHEQNIDAMPSIGGMLSRRLEPARMTCDSVFRWLDQMANRVSQASQLLRTRIDVQHEKHNQEMLAAMNRRFQLQLRLQQAAELLSIAIFTYYTVNLLDYVVQELAFIVGKPLDSLLVKAISAPLLALGAFLFIRRLRSKREI